jgi:hypothetical protein
MKLPPHHQRRLHRYAGLACYFLYLLRHPRLAVEPPERCRTRLLAALAAQAGGHSN